ncbi:MAG TPA: helix-turn-helix transcriptional regulator [Polyangiaceae bacterium]|nr:helix-turn-helix transcriptional regulator [Polyangiaceae bacterium]
MRPAPRKRKKTAASETRGRATATLHHRETPRFGKLNAILAKRLRALRHARDMTIEQACEAASVEPMTWYRLENQRGNPTLAVLASVAAVFGMRVAQLLDEE